MSDAAGGDDGVEGAPDALSVSELNARIAGVVDDPMLGNVAVVGEVSDWYESSAACYFTLTDEDAELPCTLWRNRYRELDCEVEDGDEILAVGDVDYWTDGGKLSLHPTHVRVLGAGDRLAEVEALRRDLRSRGWFDEDAKRPIPRYPDRVGIVTSRGGDARYDIQQSVHERHPGVDIVLQHSGVQGDGAPGELAAGIAALDGEVDVIVVGRGGGSDTDLAAFDTETVAEAIRACETPVVSAVGHREDVTIADEVADASAITPTAAGALVAPNYAADRERFDGFETALAEAFATLRDDRLERLAARLDGAFAGLAGGRLETLDSRLVTAADARAERELTGLRTGLESAHERLVDRRLMRLEDRLEAAHRGFERERELEREREAAVEEARREVPLVYRAALVALVLGLVALAVAVLVLFVL